MAGMGLQPIGILGQASLVDRGQYWIANNYGTNIFFGDPVAMQAGGVIELGIDADFDTFDIVGTFVGCEYTDVNGQRQWSNHYPASQAKDGTVAYVADNPLAKFRIKIGNGSGVDDTLTRASIGFNFDIEHGLSGSTQSGMSGGMLDSSAGANTAANYQVIWLDNDVNGPITSQTSSTTYTHAIVVISPSNHLWAQDLGI